MTTQTKLATKTTEPKATPGPWRVGTFGKNGTAIYGETGRVCVMRGGPDARLIAAAPELLEWAQLLERTIVYEIKKDTQSGDDEGARMKTVTLNLVRDLLDRFI